MHATLGFPTPKLHVFVRVPGRSIVDGVWVVLLVGSGRDLWNREDPGGVHLSAHDPGNIAIEFYVAPGG
jgi:hypothetical protein